MTDKNFYMNVHTGSVDTLENWQAEQAANPEAFPESELSTLLCVVKDSSGDWVEAE